MEKAHPRLCPTLSPHSPGLFQPYGFRVWRGISWFGFGHHGREGRKACGIRCPKCAFLRESARITQTEAQIINQRIETLAPATVDVITARALAPLSDLLAHARPFLGPKTECLFLKGQHIDAELTQAHKMWIMQVDLRPSRSDPSGSVVRVREVSNVNSV